MVEITDDEGSRVQMLNDIRRELKLASLSNDGLTPKQHKRYVEDGAKIRMEWVTNWIQRLMGIFQMLRILNPEQQQFPEFVKNQPPDWKWNKEKKEWSDRFRLSEGGFKAYWVSFRDVATDIPIIVMTVQWFGDRSRHMYVARTLASFKKQIVQQQQQQPLLLPLHSRVAFELWKLAPESYKFIVSNPVRYVREFLTKHGQLNVTTDKSGELQISVTREFMELWKTIEPTIEFKIWCY